MELPSHRPECPIKCLHCIHKNVETSDFPALKDNEIINILEDGRAMGIENLNIYPHNDEISLEPIEILKYIKLAHSLGYKIKTLSNGANAKGL
ncbi:MAG: hypothetical protein K0U38_10445, partial [Epsilonproteobacteria bacterium]|nr:hypothetical protein [Campylobacterota bacterium]